MPFLQIADSTLEYVWYGPDSAEAPTMVFLHGGLGCAASWNDYPALLAEASGFGALVYSRAGYGSSEPASLPRPVRFMHDEALVVLPAILEFFKIRRAILIGHSDGGSIAIIHSGNKSRLTPILAIVLEAPHVFVEDITISSITESLNRYRDGALKSSLAKYHADPDHTFLSWSDVWLSPEFRSWNIEHYLAEIAQPVLVIQGEQDDFGTIRQVESISQSCSGYVQTCILPGCGHRPHRRLPEQTMRITLDFLKANILYGGQPE